MIFFKYSGEFVFTHEPLSLWGKVSKWNFGAFQEFRFSIVHDLSCFFFTFSLKNWKVFSIFRFRKLGWRLGLQAVTGLLALAFFLPIVYRSANLYHPQRRAIMHLKNQRKKMKEKKTHTKVPKPPMFDFSPLKSKGLRILMTACAFSSLGIYAPIFYLVSIHNIFHQFYYFFPEFETATYLHSIMLLSWIYSYIYLTLFSSFPITTEKTV